MKILVVRFSSIGDIVLTSPVVRCLHQIKGVDVHFLTKRVFGDLMRDNPYIEKTYVIDKKIEEILPFLKEEHYDCIIDLHRNIRTYKLTMLLGVKTFRFNKLNFKKWLLTKFHINKLPNIHIVDRYMNTVKTLGVKNDGSGLNLFIPDNQFVNMTTLIPVEEGKYPSFIAIVIGAAHTTKRLPTAQLVELCQTIREPIVLIGGPGDQKRGQIIKEQAGSHVVNSCGRYSIIQSASIVSQSRLVITHDTGMMHIAAAFYKRIISIWGNTIPEFGMSPYYGKNTNLNTTIQTDNLNCRPCSKIGYDQCPRGHFHCMKKISIPAIVKKATAPPPKKPDLSKVIRAILRNKPRF